MIRMFDYKCLKCNEWTEALIETDTIPEAIYCDCGGVAQRRWRKAPGMVGDGAYYRHCKANGLEVLGKNEWKHSEKSSPSTVEDDRLKESQIEEACEKAYQQVIIGGQSRPKSQTIEIGNDDLDATEVS